MVGNGLRAGHGVFMRASRASHREATRGAAGGDAETKDVN